jgi:hypothetical protein
VTRVTVTGIVTLVAALSLLDGAAAFDAEKTFAKRTWIASLEGGGGAVTNLEQQDHLSDIELWDLGARVSLLPFELVGRGPLHGALEVGLEPLYQRYVSPRHADYMGLALVGRYHFLVLGRFVPFLEIAGAAGATSLRVPEIDSSFAFWTAGGVGAAVFVTDTTSVYAGYRMVHISNGNTSSPNRGFEVSTGVAGVSWFLK